MAESQIMFIPNNQIDYADLNKISNGEKVYITVRTIPDTKVRSVDQNNLFWASCAAVAENTDNKELDTKDKVCEYTKIVLRHVDYWMHYENKKTGETTLNLKTKSISFENLDHWCAIGFYDDAFKLHADMMGHDVDSWIAEVKSKMKKGTV